MAKKFIYTICTFLLLASCGEKDVKIHFSEALRDMYSDAISATYDTENTVVSLCLKTGKAYTEKYNGKMYVSGNGNRSIVFSGVPLHVLANVAEEDPGTQVIFRQLGNCDISLGYDFATVDDGDEVRLMTSKEVHHFILG